MSTANLGQQNVVFDFKHPATGEDFNKLLRGVIKPGIYSGGFCTSSTNQVTITPFRVFFQTDTDKGVLIYTESNIIWSMTNPNDVLYMTYTYSEVEENWIDFGERASTDAPVDNEIILCRVTWSGANIDQVYNDEKTYGLFDEDFNMRIDGTLSVITDPTTNDHVGNLGYNDDRYMSNDYYSLKLEEYQNRLEKTEHKLLHTTLDLYYLSQRVSNDSDGLVETFFNESFSVSYTDLVNPAVIMDDTDFNNNWKRRDGDPLFKNGFAKPSNMNYMLEEIEKYNLNETGYQYPMSMSRYDSVNNCYWMIWIKTAILNASGQTNELLKISPDMEGGRSIRIAGRWRLNADSTLTNGMLSGIDVTLDGAYLFITLNSNSISYLHAGIGKLAINTDGTLGENHVPQNQKIVWPDTGWSAGSDFAAHDYMTRTNNGRYYPDCTVWDENHVAVLFIEADASSPSGDNEGSIRFIEIADNGAGVFTTSNPRDNIELLGFFDIPANFAASELGSFSMIKEGNDLWVKANNHAVNHRIIQKFDVSEDSYSGTITQDVDSYTGDIAGYLNSSGVAPRFIKASDRYDAYKDNDPQGDTIANEAITLSTDGHILEVVSNGDAADNGEYLVKRALKNAKYGEGQTVEKIVFESYDSVNFPVEPLSCMVEDGRYYWVADEIATVNQVDIFRYDTLLGTYKHARLTNASWTILSSLATDGTNLILQGKATNYERYLGTLASFVALMGDTYNITNTISLGSAWGTITADHTTGTNVRNGITWDGDDSVWLISNLTSAYIDTLSADGVTYTEDVYARHTAVYFWGDIVYKNGLIYCIDRSATTAPTIIEVFSKDINRYGQITGVHFYQDPSFLADTNGIRGIDFNGNDLVLSHQSNMFFRIKTLEDPDVMQLHTHLESRNGLYSMDVSCCTPIQDRYFEPEEFTEYLPVDVNGVLDMSGAEDHWEHIPSTRNVPDRKYMVVGYYVPGFSILHLDEFLAGRSSTGMPRYDVTKIKFQHFENAGVAYNRVTMMASGNIYPQNNYRPRHIEVEKEIIIVVSNGAASMMIDLKNGSVMGMGNGGDTLCGCTYKGSITQRNEGMGWNDTYNPKLPLSNSIANKIQMRTFTKEDTSEYEGGDPITIAMIGTDTGADILRIEWDDNGNRTATRVNKNLFNDASTGQYAIFLSPSGDLFAGDYVDNGDVYKLSDSWKAWDIISSNIGRTSLLAATDDYYLDISPNSLHFKTPTGEDRHFLVIGSLDGTSVSTNGSLQIMDVENGRVEFIFNIITNGLAFTGVDVFEDKIFGMSNYYTNGGKAALVIAKKNYFNDSTRIVASTGLIAHRESSNLTNTDGSPSGNWSTVEQITNKSRPRFIKDIDYGAQRSSVNSGHKLICFSAEEQILQSWGDQGLNFQHFNSQDICIHESVERDTDNPTHFHYIQSKIASDGFDIEEY